MASNYSEQGTSVSGYSEEGPFHCEDCTHLREECYCIHPVVINDPQLKSHKRKGNLIEINPVRGCCRYVRQNRVPDKLKGVAKT